MNAFNRGYFVGHSDLVIPADIASEIRRIAEILYPLSSFGPTDRQFNWHAIQASAGRVR